MPFIILSISRLARRSGSGEYIGVDDNTRDALEAKNGDRDKGPAEATTPEDAAARRGGAPPAFLSARRTRIKLAAGLLLCMLGLLLGTSRRTSVTVDEFGHLPAGHSYLITANSDWLTMNPPLHSISAALPVFLFGRADGVLGLAETPGFWEAGQVFLEGNRDRYHEIFMTARTGIMALALLAALTGYSLARRTGGSAAGLATLALFALSPDFLAHGSIVTADVAAALAGLVFVLSVLRYRAAPTWINLGLAGLGTSLLFLAKFSSLAFLPLLPALLLIPLPSGTGETGVEARADGAAAQDMATERPADGESAKSAPTITPAKGAAKSRALAALRDTAIIAGLALLVLNAAYLFQGGFRTLGSQRFRSAPLSAAGRVAPFVPAPVPWAYLRAFDRQLAEHRSEWPMYMFGRLTHDRSPWYYAVCFLYKSPLALVVLLPLCLLRTRRRDIWSAAWTLGPGLWFLLLLSVSPAKQIGARLALPFIGFVLVFVGTTVGREFESLAAGLKNHGGDGGGGKPGATSLSGAAALVMALLCVWCGVSTLLAHPHYISYFNELAGGPRLPHRGHEILADSNLDWGQDLIRLREWQEEEGVEDLWLAAGGMVDPAVHGVRYRLSRCEPRAGIHAVSVNLVLGIDEFRGAECYKNFHRLNPVRRVGASIWIYKLP